MYRLGPGLCTRQHRERVTCFWMRAVAVQLRQLMVQPMTAQQRRGLSTIVTGVTEVSLDCVGHVHQQTVLEESLVPSEWQATTSISANLHCSPKLGCTPLAYFQSGEDCYHEIRIRDWSSPGHTYESSQDRVSSSGVDSRSHTAGQVEIFLIT